MSTSSTSTPSQISVTRALVELKTLDKRVQKTLQSSTFVSFKVNKQNVRQTDTVEEAPQRFQSVMDMVERRNRLKSAIIMSNANTKVKVGNVMYTVAEAIERKSSIQNLRLVLETLRRQYANVTLQVEQSDARMVKNCERFLEQYFGKDAKTDIEKRTQVQNEYMENNKTVLVDPLGVRAHIEKLDAQITTFENDVDFALSESNALTTVAT
jgi:hypothetical protein